MNVTETYIDQRFQFLGDGRNRLEELIGLADRHLKHIVDALALVMHGQRVLLVPLAPALIADHIHGRQEVHLDDLDSGPLAGLAASTSHVEAEAARRVAARLRALGLREEVADFGEEAHVGRRVRARGASDRALVDLYQLVDVLDTLQ